MFCPIQYYCSICARHCNHTTLRCPNTEALEYRKPTCLEQLIPPSLLDAYGIDSVTPLPELQYEKAPRFPSVMEIVDTERDVRAALLNYGKSEKGKIKDLKIRLNKVADELGKTLVFIKPVT